MGAEEGWSACKQLFRRVKREHEENFVCLRKMTKDTKFQLCKMDKL